MYQTHKTYIRPDMQMAGLISENPSLLLMLEHFNIDFAVGDKTIVQLCEENDIDQTVFLIIGNLYNGFYPGKEDIHSIHDIAVIIRMLRNSHPFYKNDKYPEIKEYIQKLQEYYPTGDVRLIGKFFDDYFEEVREHLDYEDEIAFPYFILLINQDRLPENPKFSVQDYKEHHTDIETKLTDLKNLLLKHIELKGNLPIRRKLLCSLFEVENDLKIHSLIEETILLPLIAKVEEQRLNG